ncbi:MAG: OB-fold nucleic acid binding domain-containing protein, partial [Patescibacteria group bacterium]
SRTQPSIRFGLSAIKNVGTAAIEAILQALRKAGSFESLRDFVTRVDLSKVNKKTLESLIKTGALDKFGSRAALLTHVGLVVDEVQKEKRSEARGQIGLFVDDRPKGDDNLPEVEEFSKAELLRFEKELLGFYLTEHPLTPLLSKISNKVSHNIGDIALSDVGSVVVVGGIVMHVKKIITKSGSHEMAFVKLSDLTGSIELVVFPRTYAQNRALWGTDTVIVVKGKVDEKDNRMTILVEEVFAQ